MLPLLVRLLRLKGGEKKSYFRFWGNIIEKEEKGREENAMKRKLEREVRYLLPPFSNQQSKLHIPNRFDKRAPPLSFHEKKKTYQLQL